MLHLPIYSLRSILLYAIVLLTGFSAMAQEQSIDPENLPNGQNYLAQTYRDWQRICNKSDQGEDQCHIYQLIKSEDDLPLGELILLKATEPEGISAAATIVVPLGTLLTARLKLIIDQDTTGDYPFSWCDKAGCYARVALTDDEVLGMKRGNSGSIHIESVSAPGVPVTLPVSFLGFTAAIGDLR